MKSSVSESKVFQSHSTVKIDPFAVEGMLGNQDKMVQKSKVCMRIQSHLILAN